MSYSNTTDRLKQGQMSGNRNSLKDSYVDLKVNRDTTEKEARIRLIGLPFAFMQYSARMNDPETKKRVEVDYPDKDEKPKFARNWILPTDQDDRYPEDPWSKAGYCGSLRYAQNVLLRHDDGSFEVKILEKGKMLYDAFTEIEDMNRRRNEQRGKNYVTCLGGETSHDLLVVAQFNPKKPLVADLKVAAEPELVDITDEEIEALKKIGAPTEEELEELFARHPQLEELPRWFWYGFQLNRIYKPDLWPGTEIATKTSRGELDMSSTESDDEEDVAAPASVKPVAKPATKPAAASASKPAAKPAASAVAVADEDEDNAFGGEEEKELDSDW